MILVKQKLFPVVLLFVALFATLEHTISLSKPMFFSSTPQLLADSFGDVSDPMDNGSVFERPIHLRDNNDFALLPVDILSQISSTQICSKATSLTPDVQIPFKSHTRFCVLLI